MATLKSPPKPAPDAMYRVVSGFSLDLPGVPAGFCPPVDTLWRGDHAGIRHLLAHGGLGKFIVPAESSHVEIGLARAKALDLPLPEPESKPTLQPVPQVRCIRRLEYTAGLAPRMIGGVDVDGTTIGIPGAPSLVVRYVEPGTLLDESHEAALKFPDHFERVEEE